jgi:translocator protein
VGETPQTALAQVFAPRQDLPELSDPNRGIPMSELASPGQLRAAFLRWALVLVTGVELLGFLSGQLGDDASSAWFQSLDKPAIFPPPATFGIVWSILFAMIALALALLISARGAPGRRLAIVAWIVQFILILCWSPLFFGAHQISASLFLLFAVDLAVLVTVWLAWRVRPLAAALLLPFFAWVLFATLLNYEFLAANPDADGREVSGAKQRIEI